MNSGQCTVKTDKSMREEQAHGTAEFPCAIYSTEKSYSSPEIVPWHWHDEFEVVFLSEGNCTLRVPGREERLEEGTVAFINSNTLHYIEGSPGYVLKSFVFSPLLITGDKSSAFYTRYVGPLIKTGFLFHVISTSNASTLFDKAYEAERVCEEAWEFTVRENLSKLLFSVFADLRNSMKEERENKSTDSLRTEIMLSYIEEHYASPLTLKDISSRVSLSERETLRCFKRTTGTTPIKYLLKYRLMKGADLLRKEVQVTVSEVALRSGFDSPSYFSKEFRRFYKLAPKEYRKMFHE